MAVIQTYVSDAMKADAERTFAQMGMTVGEGVRMFLHTSIAKRALPFKPKVCEEPTDELLKAIEEAREGKNMIRIGTSEDLKRFFEGL